MRLLLLYRQSFCQSFDGRSYLICVCAYVCVILFSRKERAEVEALQATIEKMKVEYEAARKKWKVAERRYEIYIHVQYKYLGVITYYDAVALIITFLVF